MSAANDGGPAFPMIRDARYLPDWDHEAGMSLRDYFAAKAMAALLSNFGWMKHAAKSTDMPGEVVVPQMAYELADAMLKAREVQS